MTIKELRLAAGMTQEQLAHKVGVTVTTINRWELGKCKPHQVIKKRLDQVLERVSK